ncbi:MAG TPA: hypothetical protein VD947_04465 [Patescibacteria group bacterium]|nr:hypothetical protein [Patescibacteria group bacterium]
MEPEKQNNNPSNNPNVIKPSDKFFQPTVPTGPPPEQPSQHEYTDFTDEPKINRKKIAIILIGVISLIFLILILVMVFSSNGKKDDKKTPQATPTSDLAREPTAIDIENTNNSISSDITKLDDSKDFPEENLTEKNLEL